MPLKIPEPKSPFRLTQFHLAETLWRWEQWKVLFMLRKGEDRKDAEERMGLYASTAPHLMQLLRNLLLDDVTLRIARMADPAVTGKKTNLSLARLLVDAKAQLLGPDFDAASEALASFMGVVSKVTMRRSKVVAHADLSVETGAEAEPTFTDTDVDNCLAAAVAFMERVDPERGKSSFGYGQLMVRTDARHLISALREARDAREQRKRGCGPGRRGDLP